MVEGGAGPEFPVVFYDGEREMNIGSIRIYPLLEFKAFQLMLSQRIGISPNQISIYLCDRKTSKLEDRRRIPITGKANFSLIAREIDCFFLVVLKRSRKSRNRKIIKPGGGFVTENESFSSVKPTEPPPPGNPILLRRTHPNQFGSPFFDQISPLELENLNEKLQSLKIQREEYNYSMGVSSIPMHRNNPFPRIQDTFPVKMKAKCEQCRKGNNGNEEIPSFHHCKNDPVIVGVYRSRFGPVSPAGFC